MNKLGKVLMAFMLALSLLHVSLVDVEASSQVDKFVSIAMAEKGSGYKSKYGVKPWCASFVSWAARQAGIPKSVIPATASSYEMYKGVKKGGGEIVNSPQKGDLVFYKKSSKESSICHVGIMTSSSMSIQGNYSSKVKYMSPYDYIDSNGNKTNRSKMIFVRPNYGSSSGTPSDDNTSNNDTTPKPTVKPTVTKTSIAKFTVKGITSKVEYTGKAIKPEITLYNGNTKIASNNYSVTYKNNTNPGKATITIKGKNTYTGTITKTFTILEVDYSKLKKAKAAVPADLSIYTDESVTALNTALTNANKLKSTSIQKTVDASTLSLTSAISALQIKMADYHLVDEALLKVPADLSDYTKESAALLNQAVASVVREKLITEQADVDKMALDIENAIASLELNPFRSEVIIPVIGGAGLLAAGVYFVMKNKNKKKLEMNQL